MSKDCDNCKFSGVTLAPDKSLNNICRRHPPKVVPVPVQTRDGMQMHMASVWPGIGDGDYCGEYEGKLSS